MPNFADIQKSVSEWLCVTEHEKAKTPMTVTFEHEVTWLAEKGVIYSSVLIPFLGKRVKVTVEEVLED